MARLCAIKIKRTFYEKAILFSNRFCLKFLYSISEQKKGPLKRNEQTQVSGKSTVVTTNNWLNLNFSINAPSREQLYGYLVTDLSAPNGLMYEGYTYSVVLDGGYSGGTPDTSRVEIIMCVNYADPLQSCRYLRTDANNYTPQHDSASFSGFPIVTPSSKIAYFIKVLKHIGPFQPYPYPTPVKATFSSKLYYQ